jgi:hypothetical protein
MLSNKEHIEKWENIQEFLICHDMTIEQLEAFQRLCKKRRTEEIDKIRKHRSI